MPDTHVTLGLIQHACPIDSPPAKNLAKAVDMIREAASKGAQIIATQELFTGYYFPQAEDDERFDLAEPIPGPTTDTLCRLADELDVVITASLFEKRAMGLYHNTSVMIDHTGRIIGKYRKMHIPDDPRFYEKYYFTPGDTTHQVMTDSANEQTGDKIPGPDPDGFDVQHTRHAVTGMLVCWDQWFPEAARLTALRGAQILFYPTAIGWYHGETDEEKPRQRDAWITIQRSHAIANGVYVAAINRVGVEQDLTFWGSSFVADPGGRIIAQASGDQEEVLIAECDLALIEQARRGWPFLRDRRVDAYHGLLRRVIDQT